MVEQHRALGAENGEGGGASSMILPSLVDLGLGADVTEVRDDSVQHLFEMAPSTPSVCRRGAHSAIGLVPCKYLVHLPMFPFLVGRSF